MLTANIELPPISRLIYARKPGKHSSSWTMCYFPGNKILAYYETEEACRADVAEMKVRIAVARALGA